VNDSGASADRGEQPDYLVRLRPLKSSVPGTVRLRKLLKLALRCLSLRAVRVEEVPRGQGGGSLGGGVAEQQYQAER
jgi:hypothetical protein